MRLYGGEDTEQQKAVGKWLVDYAESRERLDLVELKHTCNEVNDIAGGLYDRKVGKTQQRVQSKDVKSLLQNYSIPNCLSGY